MKLFYKLSIIAVLLLLSQQQTRATALNGDTTLYEQVVDSLIRIAFTSKQLHPIVIVSESKRLRKPKGPNDESLSSIVHSYAEDSINYLHNSENYKVLENRQLRKVLLSIGQFDRTDMPLSFIKTPAQIHYKANGWTVFKSFEKTKQYRKRNPEFFCVADITKPIYAGDYAIVVIDRQFNLLGGGGYMHIFKKLEGKWQTYALVNLWHY
jgi:hypothetical protein